jgi:nicotinamide mononucleotide (NMN) deamidase PncC
MGGMKRANRSGVAAALGLAVTVATGCAGPDGGADEPDPPRHPAAVTLTTVATAEAPSAGTVGPDGAVWIPSGPGGCGC